jgi:phosphotransacetylase
MLLKHFEQLYEESDRRREPIAVAVAGACDPTAIEALGTATDRGWISPILIGVEHELRRIAAECERSLDDWRIIDSDQAGVDAVAEVHSGRAQMLMKGRVSTPALMRAVLDPASGLRTDRIICQVVLMEISTTGRSLLLADTGICVQPDIRQKAEILSHAVQLAHALGCNQPRVALMAATETVTESMPETLDAAELERRGRAGEFPGCIVQGPLSFDLAYAGDTGIKKRVSGAVVGAADVLIFPNLVSANLTVKGIMYTAPCRFGGVLCGCICPVSFMSRSDSAETRLNSLALALQMCPAR